MNRILFLFLCNYFISFGLSAGTTNADSLKFLLNGAVSQQRVDILNDLGWELKYTDTKAAFKYLQEAQHLAGQLKYSKGKGESFRNMAALFSLTNNAKEAIHHANEGILYATAVRDTFTLAKLYNIKALVLKDQYAYSVAIEFFKKSYQLFDQLGDQEEKAGLMNNLAVLYGAINEKNLELETLIRVVELEEKTGNKPGLARTYNNIAGVYHDLGDMKSSLIFFQKGLNYSREIESARFESSALNGIGMIMQEQKKYDSAIVYYSEAANINKKNDYKQWLANNYVNLGGLFLNDLSDYPHAKKYLGEATEIYESIYDWDNFLHTMNMLIGWHLDRSDASEANRLLTKTDSYIDSVQSALIKRDHLLLKYRFARMDGNTGDALNYLEQVIALNDTLRAKEQFKQSLEIQTKYDLTRQQQENERLRMNSSLSTETIKRQQIIIAGTIIICLLLGTIIFLAYRSKKRMEKVNKALFQVSVQIREKATELQQANESKDKFLSIISHDLKNPINAITGLSDLLLDESADIPEEERMMYIKYINDGCLSADHLLENLMKWVRSQTGKLEIKPKEFDLSDSVDEAMALVSNAAFRKQITISSKVLKDTKVYADHEMVNTCLINLLSNAVKFTPLNGSVQVIPESNGTLYKVHVKDTGVGISPENMNKLFRLDAKSGTPGTANEKGTGLGLLLVKEFAEKNNGSISVESKPGEGSTFTLMIPKA